MSKPQPRTRREWEDSLRERLLQEKVQYELIAAEYKRLAAIGSDVQNLDGTLAVRQAIALQKSHYESYLLAVRQFNDLILYGKLPTDVRTAPSQKKDLA